MLRSPAPGSPELLLIFKQTEVPSGRLMSLPEFGTDFEAMNEIRCRVEYLNTFKQAFEMLFSLLCNVLQRGDVKLPDRRSSWSLAYS